MDNRKQGLLFLLSIWKHAPSPHQPSPHPTELSCHSLGLATIDALTAVSNWLDVPSRSLSPLPVQNVSSRETGRRQGGRNDRTGKPSVGSYSGTLVSLPQLAGRSSGLGWALGPGQVSACFYCKTDGETAWGQLDMQPRPLSSIYCLCRRETLV